MNNTAGSSHGDGLREPEEGRGHAKGTGGFVASVVEENSERREAANTRTDDDAQMAGAEGVMERSQQEDANKDERKELPWAFIDCPTDDLVILIAHMLNRLMKHNDQVPLTTSHLTRFHSRAPPGISVLEYLRRIVRYTNLEKLPLLSLLAYIDTTCLSLPTFTLSSLTVHRFLISGVTAGSKALCDAFCTNAHYAKVGGIRVAELNALEREFLKITEWAVCVPAELLQQYYTSLITSHGGYRQADQPFESPFTSFPLSTHPSRDADHSESGAVEAGGTRSRSVDELVADRAGLATRDARSPTGSDKSSSVATSTACSPDVANGQVHGDSSGDGDAMDVVEDIRSRTNRRGKGALEERATRPHHSDKEEAYGNAVASSSTSPPQKTDEVTMTTGGEANRGTPRSRSSRGSSRSGQSSSRGGPAVTRHKRPGGMMPTDRTDSTTSFASTASHSGSSGAFHPVSEGRSVASPRVDASFASGRSGSNAQSSATNARRSSHVAQAFAFPTQGDDVGAGEDVEMGGGAIGRRLRESLSRNDSDPRRHAVSLDQTKADGGEDNQHDRSRRRSEDSGHAANASGSLPGFGFMGGLFRHKRDRSRSNAERSSNPDEVAETGTMKERAMEVDVPEASAQPGRTAPRDIPSSLLASTSAFEMASTRRRPEGGSSVPHPGSVTPLIRSRSGGDRASGSGSSEPGRVAGDGGSELMDGAAKRTRRGLDRTTARGGGDGMEVTVG